MPLSIPIAADFNDPAVIRRLVFVDDLTELPNRRAYRQIPRLACQVLADVEGLHWINKQWGHAAGDALLQTVAWTLGRVASQYGGRCFRLGGDEFVLEFASRSLAFTAMELARMQLAEAAFSWIGGEARGIGLLYGLGETLDQADASYRMAKRQAVLDGHRAGRDERPLAMMEVPDAV